MALRVRFGFNTLGPAGETYREARVASARSDETPGSSPPGLGAEWTPQLGQASPLAPSAVTSSGARRSGLPPLIALRIQGGGRDEERDAASGAGRSKPERTQGLPPPAAPEAEPSTEEASRAAAEAHPFLSGAWIPKFLRDSAASYLAVAAATALGGSQLGKLVDVGDFLVGLASGRKAGEAIPVLVREGSERLAREATETAAHRLLHELGEQEARTLVHTKLLPRVLKRLERLGEPITHEAVERELKAELAELAAKRTGRRVLREPPKVRLQDTAFSELHAEGLLNSPMKALDDPQRVRVVDTDTSSNVVVLNHMPTEEHGRRGLAALQKTYPGVQFVSREKYASVKARAAKATAEQEALANDPRPKRLIDEAVSTARAPSLGPAAARTETTAAAATDRILAAAARWKPSTTKPTPSMTYDARKVLTEGQLEAFGHNPDQFDLATVLAGKRPAAAVTRDFLENDPVGREMYARAQAKGYEFHSQHPDPKADGLIGEPRAIAAYQAEVAKLPTSGLDPDAQRDARHRALGELLGYPKASTDRFLARAAQIRRYEADAQALSGKLAQQLRARPGNVDVDVAESIEHKLQWAFDVNQRRADGNLTRLSASERELLDSVGLRGEVEAQLRRGAGIGR